MSKLSEWLKIMLGEIARKQEDAARAAAEQKQRQAQGRKLPASGVSSAVTVQEGSGSNGSGLALAPPAPHPAASTGAQIAAQPAGVVAFVGRCQKGPVNEPVAITDLSQFEQHFGGLWSQSLLPHAVEQFFEHGGQHALIVRVVSEGLAPSIDLPAGEERLVLVALSPGSHEFLRVAVDYDGIGQQDQDLFNLVVQRVRSRGSELVLDQEIFRRVSILGGSARDVARMLSASRLVRVSGRCRRSGRISRAAAIRAS